MAWTPERIEALVEMRRNGMTFGQIANVLGVTRSAMIGKAHRMGMCERRASAPKMARLPRRIAAPARKPPSQRPIALRGPPKDPAPMPTPAADDVARVSLLDLEPHHCRWPVGEPTQGFCGCDKVPGLSYCAGHAVRAHTSPTPTVRAFSPSIAALGVTAIKAVEEFTA